MTIVEQEVVVAVEEEAEVTVAEEEQVIEILAGWKRHLFLLDLDKNSKHIKTIYLTTLITTNWELHAIAALHVLFLVTLSEIKVRHKPTWSPTTNVVIKG